MFWESSARAVPWNKFLGVLSFICKHLVHKEYGSHAHRHDASAENNRTMKYYIAKHFRVECILVLD